MTRTFTHAHAVREKTPVLVGLVGPSSSGKTYSALRLAAGMRRVNPKGKTFVIDTEARRALHYAAKFDFEHVPFGAPFSPLDYMQAILYCVDKGATEIVIDSMSHEHEGPGGVLEMHQEEHARLGGREGTKLLAWGKPKAARRRMINTILQLPVNFIFCFRAKHKLKIVKGQDPEQLGYQPISGDEFIYEMTLKCLLLPGSMGTPVWRSSYEGEAAMIKLPEQFREVFGPSPQLSEDVGEVLARWSVGGADAPAAVTADEMIAKYDACTDPATYRALEDTRSAVWAKIASADKKRVKEAQLAAEKRVEAANAPPPEPAPFSLTPPTEEELREIAERERKEAEAAG